MGCPPKCVTSCDWSWECRSHCPACRMQVPNTRRSFSCYAYQEPTEGACEQTCKCLGGKARPCYQKLHPPEPIVHRSPYRLFGKLAIVNGALTLCLVALAAQAALAASAVIRE